MTLVSHRLPKEFLRQRISGRPLYPLATDTGARETALHSKNRFHQVSRGPQGEYIFLVLKEKHRKIAESREFSQKLTDEVVSSYLVEPEANRFGMINAFTNAVQGSAPLQRIEMERFAGTLLEAPL